MKINLDFIYKIFNLKLKLKNKSDKIKLSKYEDMIPMYDIYSMKIYPINKINIHYRLIDSHYRFINEEIYNWLKNLYDKYKKDSIMGPKYKYNIDVLANYDIMTLIDTSYKTLYKYSPLLGLQVSICKRNSFNPYIYHLKPYYTKMELIKLGQNMNLFEKNIDLENLIDMDLHYKICMNVSSNDVSYETIEEHHKYIIDMKMISWVCFYSFIGSFLFNNFLRNDIQLYYPEFYTGVQKMNNLIKNAPALTNDYDVYRFMWDDMFLINMKEGEVFIDRGFTSTTRDPFYSPGLNGNFGLILLKIKIPKNKKGVGLFIENFSLFPKEEEFLLPPNTQLKLISKNNDFKYYHTNSMFEKLINRKYEFELITNDTKLDISKIIKKISTNENYYDITTININGIDRIDIIKNFIKEYAIDKMINLKYKSNKFSFVYQWFDSTPSSSYQKFYHNKIKDGMLFSIYNSDGYPYLNIELGKDLAVNYLNTIYFGINNNNIDMLELIYHFGRIFNYKTALIFHKYSSFEKFQKNVNNNIAVYFSLYNDTIYEYLKFGKKYLDNEFINYTLGYWYLDEYFSKKPEDTIIERIPNNNTLKLSNNKELLIFVIENYFYLYPKIIESLPIFNNNYVTYNIYDKLIVNGLGEFFKPNLTYTNDDIVDEDFKLIFRQPIRRT